MENLKTPLFAEHKKLNAKIISFGSWDMPVSYTGIIEEHAQCRREAALFDTCHMGEFIFRGDIPASGIEAEVTQSIEKTPTGCNSYGFILNENGGVIDDLIISKISENELLLIVNAATREKDYIMLKDRLKSGELEDVSDTTSKIDLQGPLSNQVITDNLGLSIDLKFFRFSNYKVLGKDSIISRTGYTGELGYEFYLDNSTAMKLWETLISDNRVKPAGLGARDILRIEMGYSLYGNELDENTTPVEAGLENFVHFEKDFIGKGALLKQIEAGPRKTKIAFKTASRRSPRQHYKILSGSNEIGTVTSGCFSPMLNCGIGMGYIKSELKESVSGIIITDGNTVEIEAEVTELPFYKNGSARKKSN
ncbi:glycine cleavage system aminomethyltransferase GcvT [Elusimicrobiota bacterium]